MAAMATDETVAALVCLICHNSEDDDKFTSALCGHAFHTYCIDAYADAMGLTLLALPCPTCKYTGDSLADAEAALLALPMPGEEPILALAVPAEKPILIEAMGEPAAGDIADRLLADTADEQITETPSVVVAEPLEEIAPAEGTAGELIAEGTVAEEVLAASREGADAESGGSPSGGGMGGIVAVPFVWAEDQLFCSLCRSYLQKQNVRLVNKTKGVYHCKTCLCRNVKLHRAYGGWPTASFRRFSPDEQASFMRAIGQVSNQEAVTMTASMHIERFEQHAKYYMNGG